MFESISIPRKVNTADVNEAFPFKAPALDVYDIKQGRELVKLYKEYHKECFLKGFQVANLLKCETQSLDNFLKKEDFSFFLRFFLPSSAPVSAFSSTS